MFLREGAFLILAGVTAGVTGALAGGRWVAALLFGVTPTDPATLAVAVSALALTAACATYIPARRAARIDPAETLRARLTNVLGGAPPLRRAQQGAWAAPLSSGHEGCHVRGGALADPLQHAVEQQTVDGYECIPIGAAEQARGSKVAVWRRNDRRPPSSGVTSNSSQPRPGSFIREQGASVHQVRKRRRSSRR